MTDATHLDFTQYPHISRPSELEDKVELEKRSKAITDIKNKSEDLFHLMESYVSDLVSYDAKVKLLDKRDHESAIRENELNKKEKELIDREEVLQREKGYVSKLNLDLKEKEKQLLTDKVQLTDLQVEMDKFEEKRSELIKQQAVTEKKIKRLETLQEKERELEEREMVVEKAVEVDKERKRLLDIREERITAKERMLLIDRAE